MTTIDACHKCKRPFAQGGGRYKPRGNVEFCMECAQKHIWPKQRERFYRASRQDILEQRHEEMRAAIKTRDKYRQEAQALKDSLRAEVAEQVADDFRRLPFWRRVRFVFSPWEVQP